MPPSATPPTRPSGPGGRRTLAVAASLCLHLAGLLALASLRADPPRPADPAPMTLALVEAPPAPVPAPAPAAATVGAPAPAAAARAAAPPRTPARRTVAPPRTPALPAAATPARPDAVSAAGNEVGEAELAGAATAGPGDGGGGGGGGACDMARRLQDALRKDPLVRAAVSSPSGPRAGRALRVWDGDWTTNPGEDGRGLSAVREAIMWEVGFSPKACREAAVRGLVLVSLADLPGAPRLVLGAGRWRWSDLLTPRSGGAPVAAEDR